MCTPSSVYHDGADGTMPQAEGDDLWHCWRWRRYPVVCALHHLHGRSQYLCLPRKSVTTLMQHSR